MLHNIALDLGLEEAMVQAAMLYAIDQDWIAAGGSSLPGVCLTDAGRTIAARPAPKRPAPRRALTMTLDLAIAQLYTREINCGLQTFWRGGMTVWIGDLLGGRKVEATFPKARMSEAGAWLIDTARRLHPDAFR